MKAAQASDTIGKALNPLWSAVKQLFAEHHFVTVICGFFAVVMIISFYRFLRSVSPALVGLFLLIVLFILLLHWTQTRTEPAILKPFIDWLAPFLPAPEYKP